MTEDLTWIDLVGFCGSGLAVWTYLMREMIPLRIVAVVGSLCFLAYAGCIHSYPIMLMEGTLLPINAYRLLQLLRPAPLSPAPLSPEPLGVTVIPAA